MMQPSMRERERELATSVEATRAALLAVLAADDVRSKAGVWIFEERAAQLDHPPAELARFQASVNALWVHLIEARVPEAMASAWFRLRRKANVGWIARADVEAEAMVKLRDHIALPGFEPRRGVLFKTFCEREMMAYLDGWASNLGSPVDVPRSEVRRGGPGPRRAGERRE